jgi:predicted nucleic acid-binding protein
MPVFFDTDVLAYAFRGSDPRPQQVAHDLILRHLVDDEAIISTQVVVEFANAC